MPNACCSRQHRKILFSALEIVCLACISAACCSYHIAVVACFSIKSMYQYAEGFAPGQARIDGRWRWGPHIMKSRSSQKQRLAVAPLFNMHWIHLQSNHVNNDSFDRFTINGLLVPNNYSGLILSPAATTKPAIHWRLKRSGENVKPRRHKMFENGEQKGYKSCSVCKPTWSWREIRLTIVLQTLPSHIMLYVRFRYWALMEFLAFSVNAGGPS